MRQIIRNHSNSHKLVGPDPAEVGLHPASLMGYVLGGTRLSNGFGMYGGTLYIPDRDGPALTAGEEITVSYAHFEPTSHFDWLAARIHLVSGLTADFYDHVKPWVSDPWNGSTSDYQATDPYPEFGGWQGLVTFMACTNDDGETVTWTYPDTGAEAEQFSFDDTGVGHIGYSFHNFGSPHVSGDVTAAFSGASTERQGGMVWVKSTSPTIGAVVGETIMTGAGGEVANSVVVTLTDDIPDGSQLVVVTASHAPDGFSPTDAGARPQVFCRLPSGSLALKWRSGQQHYMFSEVALNGAAVPHSGGDVSSSRTLTAGAGLSGGGDLSADRTFDVNVDNSTIEINSDTLRVKDGGITSAKIADGTITATDVAAANKDGTAATASMRTLGTGAAQAAPGAWTVVDHGSTGSTETIDVSAGAWHRLTLDANCTITVSGYSAGAGLSVIVKVTQDGTGGRTITWDPDVFFAGDSQPGTAANAVTYFLLWADAGDTAIYGAKIGGVPTVSESNISLSDVTTDNVTSTAHGFAPKSPADATKFLNGAATPAYAQVKDSDLSTSDITTNNVSTSKHGFAPKGDGDTTKFLNANGAYSVPSGGATWSVLTNGDPTTPELIFAGGDVIMVTS